MHQTSLYRHHKTQLVGAMWLLSRRYYSSAKASTLDLATIRERNYLLELYLHDNNKASFDVIGDGNCFYNVVSVSVYGDQKNCVDLR